MLSQSLCMQFRALLQLLVPYMDLCIFVFDTLGNRLPVALYHDLGGACLIIHHDLDPSLLGIGVGLFGHLVLTVAQVISKLLHPLQLEVLELLLFSDELVVVF